MSDTTWSESGLRREGERVEGRQHLVELERVAGKRRQRPVQVTEPRAPGTGLVDRSAHLLGGVDRAVDAAIRAGDWAAGRHAHTEAAAHYESAVQALELSENVDHTKRATLVTQLAELWMDAGDGKRGSEAALRAVALAREIGDLFGLQSDGDDTVQAYVARLRQRVCPGQKATPPRPAPEAVESEEPDLEEGLA